MTMEGNRRESLYKINIKKRKKIGSQSLPLFCENVWLY